MDDELMLNLGVTPISEDAPTGINAKYEAEYEQLVAELGKAEALSGDTVVDWSVVSDLSTTILQHKSKDIAVACYLAHGLYKSHSLEGLGTGLNIIKTMLETHFDNLFPPVKRAKARSNAMSWLADKTEPLVTALEPTVKDLDSFENCLSHLLDIQQVCDEKMAGNEPAIGTLVRAIREWRNRLKAEVEQQAKKQEKAAAPAPEVKKPEAKAAAPSSPKAAAIPIAPAAPVGELGSEQDVKAAIKSVQDVGRQVAHYKRRKNIGDPGAYSLLRSVIWMQVERLPPHENGQTPLPEMDPDRQKMIQTLLDNKSYSEVLEHIELAFCDMLFWLKGHYLAAQALQGLGHTDAQKAVQQSLAAFLQRMPGILELKFSSGSLFADEMTRIWIDEEVLGSAGGGGGAGGSEQSPWTAGLQEALSLAGKGNFKQGLDILQQGKAGTVDQRSAFMWQIANAQYFEKTGYVKLAVPLLEYLWKQLFSIKLTDWENSPMLQIAKSLSACYSNIDFVKEMTEERVARAAECKSTIYRLDVDSALLLEAQQ
ncbi:type VI secretion system protein TssA [Paraglaciecola sp.]|uniref:type VI secretion system protein TssA n=1 Tax=Paraglaciecola sp. TaxID=1920173 RepID=UPI003EF93553